MSNQYDADVVAIYDRSFTLIPLRQYVELPSVYQILGDVTGLSVLDLACRTGSRYDADVVAIYDRSFTLIPLRQYVELPSVYQILGDVTGLSVLDLACGT